MLGHLTWKDLLKFLLEQKEKGSLQEDHDVMMHNIETGDEYPCDVLEIDGRLVMAINWDTLD
jgi:hypothetical protein